MESLRLAIACWHVLDAWDGRKPYREFQSAVRSMETQLAKERLEGEQPTALQLAADEIVQVWNRDGRYHEFIAAYTKALNVLNEIEQARQG